MKDHLFASTLLALAAALAMGACDDSESSGGGSATGFGASYDVCSSFQSCDSCTPQNGCGWCYDSDGTGQCASSPDECATPAFDWTWNPDGCRVPAHASAAQTQDAGESLEASPVPTADADARDDAEANDGAAATSNDGRASTCVPADASPLGDAGDAGSSACVVEGP